MIENEITVLIVEQDKAPQVVTIENTLEAKQHIVGGRIECMNIGDDEAVIIINEEGKFYSIPNRDLYLNDVYPDEDKKKFDCVYGTFLIVGDDFKNADFRSLTDSEITKYTERFQEREYIEDYSVSSSEGKQLIKEEQSSSYELEF